MTAKSESFIMRNGVFAWIALATACILLVPLLAMQFGTAVRWSVMDFVVMGFLLFATGSAFVLAARKAPRKYRLGLGVLFAAALLYLWAELAVGVFTRLGS